MVVATMPGWATRSVIARSLPGIVCAGTATAACTGAPVRSGAVSGGQFSGLVRADERGRQMHCLARQGDHPRDVQIGRQQR